MASLTPLSRSSLFFFFLTISILPHPSNSAVDTFVYGGCSQKKYSPGTPYESNVNSLLSSLVNSAASANYSNFKISVPGSGPNDVVYGLFQCRGDVSNSDCRECVAHSVSQLGVLCVNSAGGALQLEGCFLKYDNIPFLGVQDKAVVNKKCGPSTGYDSDSLTNRDGVLGDLAAGGQYFRVGESGKVQGVAQCVQDLSVSECQDCLSEAIGRLKSECGSSAWGDMFLGKCYARYSERGYYPGNGNSNGNGYGYGYGNGYHDYNDTNNEDDDFERTLAILIGLIAAVALLIFLYAVLRKSAKKGGK